jgi:hypothetical protein
LARAAWWASEARSRSGRQDGVYLGEFIGRKVNIEGADILL